MMSTLQQRTSNEEGFVLVVALMILAILSLIGIAGLNTSMFEEQIAGNEWSAKRTFYKADGGSELGSELLEYNFSCGPITSTKITSVIKVDTADIFKTEKDDWETAHPDPLDYPSKANRDICWRSGDPLDLDGKDVCDVLSISDRGERTNLKIFGEASYNPGSAIQMAAGYEGKGKSAAGGGVVYLHEIHSQNLGIRGNEAVVRTQWRHLVGQEDPTGCY